jgi:hypothetical protein
MDWDAVAPMIVAVVLFLTVGAVAVLRPLAKRLADVLEIYARERESGIQSDVRQMRDLLETMSARLQLMEERQEFTERLLSPGEGKAKEELP